MQVHRDAVVEIDPRRVERILTNLVTNAHKHGAPPVAWRSTAPPYTCPTPAPASPPTFWRKARSASVPERGSVAPAPAPALVWAWA
ncbi:hypothetical protein [Streptomyces sp. NPDC001250]|uniref:hypothetical protein n=1 Tax=unclassified Streptomyces TaxID=2593676 RepID=UPI00332401D7